MDEYKVSLVEYPVKHLVGMQVRTSMQKAQADCRRCGKPLLHAWPAVRRPSRL